MVLVYVEIILPQAGFSSTGITSHCLSLLHSERPKLYAILAFLSAVGLINCASRCPYIETEGP